MSTLCKGRTSFFLIGGFRCFGSVHESSFSSAVHVGTRACSSALNGVTRPSRALKNMSVSNTSLLYPTCESEMNKGSSIVFDELRNPKNALGKTIHFIIAILDIAFWLLRLI